MRHEAPQKNEFDGAGDPQIGEIFATARRRSSSRRTDAPNALGRHVAITRPSLLQPPPIKSRCRDCAKR